MNLNHAFGFLFVGTIFGVLPRFASAMSAERELWLQVMSAVMIAIAVMYCGQRLLSGLATMLEYNPQRALARTPVPATLVVEAPVARRITAARRSAGQVLPVPAAAFRSGLIEQRRAA